MINIFDKKTSYKEALISNGVYDLTQMMISAETTEDIYGNYELNMEIELQGDAPTELYEMLQVDNIIKVNDEGSEELFRIAQVNKGLEVIEVYCRHITISDSLNLWLDNVRPTNENGQTALQHLSRATTPQCNLLLTSNITEQATANYVRKNLYEALFEGDNAFIKRWGGEVKRKGYTIQIDSKIGQDKSEVIKIKEALNLTGFNANSNIDEVSTVIYPIGFDGITAPRVESPLIGKYSMEFPIEIKYEDVKVKKPVEEGQTPSEQDQEGYDTLEEAQEELRRRAAEEFSVKNLDKLKFECDIDYIDLERYEEYKDLSTLQAAFLGDIISVRVDTFDMDIKARVVARQHDILRNRKIKQTISTEGTLKKPESIKDIIKDIIGGETAPEIWEGLGPYVDQMIQQGFKNGFVVYEKNAVYAVDQLPKEQAKNVVVLNKHGLGYSSTGISGPYTYGFTIDGKLNADMITTGTLHGQYIGAGTIEANKLSVNAKNEITQGLATSEKVTQLEANIDGISTKVSEIDTTVKNWRVGGYNYLINSDIELNETMLEHMHRPSFKDVEAFQTLQGQQIALSVDVDANGVQWEGSKKRAGWELAIEFEDGGIQYYGCWYNSDDATTLKKRICKTYTLPSNRPIKSMNRQRDLYIQGVVGGKIKVFRPKLEIGSTCTDWSPNKLDTDGPLGETIEKVSTIEQTNAQISTKVEENKKQIGVVDGKFVNYVTSSKFTEFKQNTEQFQFKVENQTYSNLITNGTFDGGTRGWWTNGTPSLNATQKWQEYNGQTLYVNCSSNNTGIYQRFNTNIGKKYFVSFAFKSDNVQACNVGIEGIKTLRVTNKTWQEWSFVFTATQKTHTFIAYSINSGDFYIDNIMVSEGELPRPYTDNPNSVMTNNMIVDKEGLRCNFEDGTWASMGRNGFAYKHASWSHPYQYITKVIKIAHQRNGHWATVNLGSEFVGKEINVDFKINHHIGAVDCNAFVETGQYGGALRTSFTEIANWNKNKATLQARCCIQKITLKSEVMFGWDAQSTDVNRGGIIGESAGDIVIIAQM